MKAGLLFGTAALCLALWAGDSPAAPMFSDAIKNKTRIMLIVSDGGNAGDFVDYAENLLKKGFKQKGAMIINPEIMKKIKEDKLLWEAIQNGNATAMAKISTDYGAVILARGTLSVDARQRFAASWEGSASLSLLAVDTKTAEEIANITSDPLGTTMSPAPMEDSPLIAKQIAVQKVCDNVLMKAGLSSGEEDITGAASVQLELYDVFDLSDRPAALVFSMDGKKLFVSSGSNVQVFGLLERKVLSTLELNETGCVLDVSPNGRFLATVDTGGMLYVWDADSGSLKTKTETAAGAATAIAFRPDSATVALAGDDYKIHLVNTMSGKETAAFEGHQDMINSLAFTPNGDHLISASQDLSTRWWDVNVKREKKALTENTDKLLRMSLSQDGSLVALSTVDIHIDLMRNTRKDVRHIKVRNTVTGEEIRTLDGHSKDITTLNFHASKRFLASGAVDDSVRIWDVQKGDMVSQQDLGGDVIQVVFSRDSKWLAAVSDDHKLTVWKLR
ncbi:MAG: WD40 repeat domain-containing protein [Thermodesulfobacteriota bacterium]